MKHWHEMTVEERRRDRLRHFPTLLARWKGAVAAVTELTTSHPMLIIRVEHPSRIGNLELQLEPPSYYCGPFRWENADISISLDDDLLFVISDETAGVTIRTGSVEVSENSKPLNRLFNLNVP